MSGLVGQEFFQEFGCIGNAVRAVAKGLSSADALQELALGGTVALLKL